MKGLIFGIKRMEIHDGDGLRTTVFLKGCPLKCLWCHNPEGISFAPQTALFLSKCIHCGICKGEKSEEHAKTCPTEAMVFFGQEREAGELVQELMADAPFWFSSGGGVTLSGGECLAQADFAVELAKLLHEKGVSVYVDTCGFVNRKVLERIAPYTTRFLYDIKAIDREIHKRCTGQYNDVILENLQYLCETGSSVEIRFPLVKGYNDGETEQIGAFLQGLPGIVRIKVLQYHDFSGSRYEALGMENTLPKTKTTYEDVAQAVAVLRSFGLPAVNGMDES